MTFILWDLPTARLPALPEDLTATDTLELSELAENEIAWIGHACFAMRLAGKLVLTDPFLSKSAGPVGLGPKRFVSPALQAVDLPRLDAIVISHNHYDHLDTKALAAYRWRIETPVVCPLGLGPLIRKLGFRQIVELDWWQDWQLDELRLTALPAVHFSGRGPFDRNRTLWASMALTSPTRNVWFGGDTAYGAVFREIGARLGPFDLALIGIGSYEPRSIMVASHATPEEAVSIALDINARCAIGMHWGTIMLTPEDPFEAPARFRTAADQQGFGSGNSLTMRIGEVRQF